MKEKPWLEPINWRIALCVITSVLLLLELLPGSAISAVKTETGIKYISGSFLLPNAFETAYYWIALLVTVSSWILSVIGLLVLTRSREWLVLARAVLLDVLTVNRYLLHGIPFKHTGFLYHLIPFFVLLFLIASVPASVMECKMPSAK